MFGSAVRELYALFGYQLDQRSVDLVERRIDGTRAQMQRLSTAGQAVATSGPAMWGALAGGALALMGVRQLYQANAEAESLRASLELTAGSAEAADRALGFITEFAQRSPDQINQVTAAYQRLLAQGIDPTAERMTTIGDAAAAVQLPISELVDAIGNATIGNLERMDVAFARFGYNFTSRNGVVFAQVGDQTVELGSSFADILGFVESLGRARFAGGMERQANTLAGRMSMLQDAVSAFLKTMGNAGGANAAMRDFINSLTRAAGGSERLAILLGRTVAVTFRAFGRAVEFAVAHAEQLERTLLLLGGAAVSMAIGQLVMGLRTLGSAAMLAQVQALAIPLAIGAAVAGVIIAIDDLYAYLQGRPSVLGEWLGNGDGEMQGIRRLIREAIDEQAPRIIALVDQARGAISQLAAAGRELWTALAPIREALLERGVAAMVDGFAAGVRQAELLAAAIGEIAANIQTLQRAIDTGSLRELLNLRAGAVGALAYNLSPLDEVASVRRTAIDRVSATAERLGLRSPDRVGPDGLPLDAARAASGSTAPTSTTIQVQMQVGNVVVETQPGADGVAIGEATSRTLAASARRALMEASRRAMAVPQ